MEDFLICKACGFVTNNKKVKDVCPACGVPAKMFEAYEHSVSTQRRRLLELHTHPIAVHFPQAFALTLLLLSLCAFFAPTSFQGSLSATIVVLSSLLPLFVLGSIGTGLLDGKLRFRRVTTPLLKKKIIISSVFFLSSLVMVALALCGQPFSSLSTHITYILLAAVVSLCGALLGLIGGTLWNAKFPG